MLDSALLQDYCTRFYGYGAAEAPHWFISMEEGGGDTEDEIKRRLSTWNSHGRQELEDLAAYHRAIGQKKWFVPHPPIQRTWAAMIRIVLAMSGRSTDVESVRAYQRDHLGRSRGSTRLSPLFPLPAQSLDHWNYSDWSDLPHLADRKIYRAELEATRIAHLANAMQHNAPSTVVFFGVSYASYWGRIAGVESCPMNSTCFYVSGGTKFIVCKHPAVQGLSNEYFVEIGRELQAC